MHHGDVDIPLLRAALLLGAQLLANFIRPGVAWAGTDHPHLDAGMSGFKFWPQPGFYIIHHILIARGGDVENGVGLCAKAQEEGRYDRCFRLSQHGLSPE